MKAIRYMNKLTAVAVAVLLPCSLLAEPIIVRINDTPGDKPVIQVIGAPDGWSVVPDEVDPATVDSGIITLHGVDQAGLVPELGWRFVVPNAPDPNRSSVDIVWIQHEWWGDNSLQIAFNSNEVGYYRNPEIAGDLNAGVVTDNWVTLYADDAVVVQYKPHTYRLRDQASAKMVSYQSSIQIQVVEQSYDSDTGITEQVLVGQGNSSHMGAVTVWAKIEIREGVFDPAGPSWVTPISGVEIETAANGDLVESTIQAVEIIPLPMPSPFMGYIKGTRTVTGGTGRFLGATGSMTLEGVDSDGVTLEVKGVISTVGSGKK